MKCLSARWCDSTCCRVCLLPCRRRWSWPRAAADVPRRRDAGQHRRHRRAISDGRFVADLTRENFTVLEDGAAADDLVVHAGPAAAAPTTCCCRRRRPPAPEGLVLPPAKPRADDTAGRVLLIFIDDLHFEPELSPHVRKLMQTIGDTLMHEGDLVTVVSSGPSYHRDRPDLRQEDGRWRRSARSAARV